MIRYLFSFKQLDKLLLSFFLQRLFITLPAVTVLLLIQFLLKYFDELVGKGVGIFVFAKLLFYFSLNMLPNALNISVMLAALMSYGSLEEHSELTAIRGAGISLFRQLRAVFLVVVFIAGAALAMNAYLIPKANLRAFLILYDIRRKKPEFNLPEKTFYSAVPTYNLRVNKKHPEGKLDDLIVYEHTTGTNYGLLLAKEAMMRIDEKNERLYFSLTDGIHYKERPPTLPSSGNKPVLWNELVSSRFQQMEVQMSLSSFSFQESLEERLSHMRYGKSIQKLLRERDSLVSIRDSIHQQVLDVLWPAAKQKAISSAKKEIPTATPSLQVLCCQRAAFFDRSLLPS